ncbi:unnamed protein product [Taenia asiatica]|uniref:IMD domain-containing protein n=1 Tax=Taenia asiatica TaxID=60517 RepID=A0A0R3VX51_TAEAS|nr:unnamed protein product [Taenia asiatica]
MSQPSDKRDYSWVAGYEKTWESIKEDQSGSLVASLEKMVRDTHADLRAKRQHTNATATTIGGTPRLGMCPDTSQLTQVLLEAREQFFLTVGLLILNSLSDDEALQKFK